jgi:hypothetical protein
MDITMLLIIVVGVASLIWVVRYFKRLAKQKRNRHTLGLIAQIKSVISKIQKHRALCIFGRAHQTSLKQVKSEISHIINGLSFDSSLLYNARWIGFIDHWFRLQINATNLSDADNFEQHSNMIANLSLLLEELAESANFTKEQFILLPNITMLWREFPQLIESVDQVFILRSMNRIDCNLQDKFKLVDAEKTVKQLSRIVFHHIRYNGPVEQEKQLLVDQASEACSQFIAALENNQNRSINSAGSQSTFEQQTMGTVRTSLALLDYELQQVETSLQG